MIRICFGISIAAAMTNAFTAPLTMEAEVACLVNLGGRPDCLEELAVRFAADRLGVDPKDPVVVGVVVRRVLLPREARAGGVRQLTMPLRQRCAILMHMSVWQDAYKRLEYDLVELLASCAAEISNWA